VELDVADEWPVNAFLALWRPAVKPARTLGVEGIPESQLSNGDGGHELDQLVETVTELALEGSSF
jgi:hypothetical protein